MKGNRQGSGFPFTSDHPPQRPKSQNKILFFIFRFFAQLVEKVRTYSFDKLSGGADDLRAAAYNNSCKLYQLYSVSLIFAAI